MCAIIPCSSIICTREQLVFPTHTHTRTFPARQQRFSYSSIGTVFALVLHNTVRQDDFNDDEASLRMAMDVTRANKHTTGSSFAMAPISQAKHKIARRFPVLTRSFRKIAVVCVNANRDREDAQKSSLSSH